MLLLTQDQQPTGRVGRRPNHKFNIKAKPYAIVPFMIAPVLPAETLETIWFEAREVSDSIVNPLIGAKLEYYWFYVKIRDLAERDTLDDLFINPTASIASLNAAADPKYYHRGGSPNFTQLCLKRITETFFRDEGETWNNKLIDGYPAAQFRDLGWLDSLMDTTTLPDGSSIGNPSTATSPEALDKMMDAYEMVRAMGYTTMSFEDYLATFGVHLSREQAHKPELVAKTSEFIYPANTVDPSNGVPTSAYSHVFKHGFRDKKFFKEPGFIVGLHVVRPKVYMSRQYGSLSHFLDQGLSWLPTIMAENPETSLREFTGGATGNGPLSNGTVGPTNGYWVDMRDLFLYGDQFSNAAIDGTVNGAALPTASLATKYLSDADVESMFKLAANCFCRVDGFASLTIKGTQRDHTGGHQAERA